MYCHGQILDTIVPVADYWWFRGAFSALVLLLLAVALGVFHRTAHAVSFRESLAWSCDATLWAACIGGAMSTASTTRSRQRASSTSSARTTTNRAFAALGAPEQEVFYADSWRSGARGIDAARRTGPSSPPSAPYTASTDTGPRDRCGVN
jgi:hypothetical protein